VSIDVNALKKSLDDINTQMAVIVGQEQELEQQRDEIKQELEKHKVSVDTLPSTIEQLEKEIEKESQSLSLLIQDVDTSTAI
jgi:cell division septum initiation protein DivIVA